MRPLLFPSLLFPSFVSFCFGRDLFDRMETWARDLQNILSQIATMLHPVGYEAIEANDFQMLRQMLDRSQDMP